MAAPGAPAASRGPNASSPLDAICALLQHHKNEDYAWMPECLNDYMRSALQQAVAPAAEGPGAAGTGEQHASEDRSEGGEAGASATGSAASGAAGPSTAAGEQPSGDAVIALGTSEHVKGGGARVARWVAHVGLVLAPLHARPPAPGGSSASAPAAAGTPQAAAGMAGACAVLSLQDAAPAPMGPALLAAFNKGVGRAPTCMLHSALRVHADGWSCMQQRTQCGCMQLHATCMHSASSHARCAPCRALGPLWVEAAPPAAMRRHPAGPRQAGATARGAPCAARAGGLQQHAVLQAT